MRVAGLVALVLAAPSSMAEQQASIHIKVSSEKQLRGNDKGWSGKQSCHVMDWYNWNDFKYACHWNHGINGYNLYFQRYDGSFVWECACDNGLGSYDPWDLNAWTWSKTDGVACYTRDGKSYDQVEHNFDSVTCDERFLKNCDSQKDQCAYFDRGDVELDDDSGGRCKKPPCQN